MKNIVSRECAVKLAVETDAAIYKKWLASSLEITGYQIVNASSQVTKGEREAWIIELRIEVQR